MMPIQTANMPYRAWTWEKDGERVVLLPNLDGYYEFHTDAIEWILRKGGFEEIA